MKRIRSSAGDAKHGLTVVVSYWNNEGAAGQFVVGLSQLLKDGFRYTRSAGGDEDLVEWGKGRPSEGAITVFGRYLDAQVAEHRFGPFVQGFVPFDRKNAGPTH